MRFEIACLSFAACAVFQSTFALGQQTISPDKIVGRDVCKRCHTAEYTAWEHSSHNTKAWQLLDHPKAAGFAKAIGVTDVKGESVCTTCHATQQQAGGTLTIAHGNSCESCHGGAGGTDGWLDRHYDFGLGRKVTDDTNLADLLADRARETAAHRAQRDAVCEAAGMNRSADVYALARNCLECHLVPQEKLVAAGHPISTRFEFVEWSQGEVRHNFLLDRTVNAGAPTNWLDPLRGGDGRTVEGRKRLMYVAGQLADLEVSLRNRAGATTTKRNSLGDEANDRILDIKDALDDISVANLKPILAAIQEMEKKTLRAETSNDRTIYTAAADAVAQAARDFVAAHEDGSNLPLSIEIPTKAKGDVFQ